MRQDRRPESGRRLPPSSRLSARILAGDRLVETALGSDGKNRLSHLNSPRQTTDFGRTVGNSRDGLFKSDLNVVRICRLAPKGEQHGMGRAGNGGIHVGAGRGRFINQPAAVSAGDTIDRIEDCRVKRRHVVRRERGRVARKPGRVDDLVVPIKDGIFAENRGNRLPDGNEAEHGQNEFSHRVTKNGCEPSEE